MDIYGIREALLGLLEEVDGYIIGIESAPVEEEEEVFTYNRGKWTEEEIDFLYSAVNNKEYPIPLVAKMLNRTESSIVAKAHNIGFRSKNGLIIVKRLEEV